MDVIPWGYWAGARPCHPTQMFLWLMGASPCSQVPTSCGKPETRRVTCVNSIRLKPILFWNKMFTCGCDRQVKNTCVSVDDASPCSPRFHLHYLASKSHPIPHLPSLPLPSSLAGTSIGNRWLSGREGARGGSGKAIAPPAECGVPGIPTTG